MSEQEELSLVDTDEIRRLVTIVAAVIRGAKANECVRRFISDGHVGWTLDEIGINPPARVIFELGEIRGNIGNLAGLVNYARKRKLGRYIGIEPLEPDDELSSVFITSLLSPDHPRRIRYETRTALKARLGRRHARVVTMASRLQTQSRFVEWVRDQRGLSTTIRARTGLTVKELWRRVRGKAA